MFEVGKSFRHEKSKCIYTVKYVHDVIIDFVCRYDNEVNVQPKNFIISVRAQERFLNELTEIK